MNPEIHLIIQLRVQRAPQPIERQLGSLNEVEGVRHGRLVALAVYRNVTGFAHLILSTWPLPSAAAMAPARRPAGHN